ncbi:Uncharacterised protein [Mycobacteroides abscessus subsp. massiliense]|nr:Uncharacterised protein [Mycobacteroides abscessus subsp. massiliense]
MQNSRSRRHPLSGSVVDEPASTMGVLMGEPAVDHVGDGLEAAMRVPIRPTRLAGLILDFAHLIHVDERIQLG